MSKDYKNTRESNVSLLKYVIEKGPEARVNFRGSIFDFTRWIAGRWNTSNPDNPIKKSDVGLTPEKAEELKSQRFLPKENHNG